MGIRQIFSRNFLLEVFPIVKAPRHRWYSEIQIFRPQVNCVMTNMHRRHGHEWPCQWGLKVARTIPLLVFVVTCKWGIVVLLVSIPSWMIARTSCIFILDSWRHAWYRIWHEPWWLLCFSNSSLRFTSFDIHVNEVLVVFSFWASDRIGKILQGDIKSNLH